MKKLFQDQSLFVTVGIFILILIGVVILVFGVGKAYRAGLNKFSNQPPQQEVKLIKKKAIKKITAKKANERGCIEVTPDGVVRVYSECGEYLTDASRLTDVKNILKLFKLISEHDLSKYKKKIAGDVYELTIETDQGTETYYLSLDQGSGTVNEIVQTIENIQGDLPQASASPNPSSLPPNPSSSEGAPHPSYVSTPSPRASPGSGGAATQPFTCEFTDAGGAKKPYNVSNVICSTEPSTSP